MGSYATIFKQNLRKCTSAFIAVSSPSLFTPHPNRAAHIMPHTNEHRITCKHSLLLPEHFDALAQKSVTVPLVLGFETRLITKPRKKVLEKSSSETKFQQRAKISKSTFGEVKVGLHTMNSTTRKKKRLVPQLQTDRFSQAPWGHTIWAFLQLLLRKRRRSRTTNNLFSEVLSGTSPKRILSLCDQNPGEKAACFSLVCIMSKTQKCKKRSLPFITH